MSLQETPVSHIRVLRTVLSDCSKHSHSVSDTAFAAGWWMQTPGYKRLLINAVKQETYGSLHHLKVYPFVLKTTVGFRKTRLLFVKPIASCLIKAGFFVCLFPCFFKWLNFKSDFIVTDGEMSLWNSWSMFNFLLKVWTTGKEKEWIKSKTEDNVHRSFLLLMTTLTQLPAECVWEDCNK